MPRRGCSTTRPEERAMRIDAISIFPEYLAALDLSLIGKARTAGLVHLEVHDLREFTHDRHRTGCGHGHEARALG